MRQSDVIIRSIRSRSVTSCFSVPGYSASGSLSRIHYIFLCEKKSTIASWIFSSYPSACVVWKCAILKCHPRALYSGRLFYLFNLFCHVSKWCFYARQKVKTDEWVKSLQLNEADLRDHYCVCSPDESLGLLTIQLMILKSVFTQPVIEN